ncbi:hypothetical protein ACFVWN_08745 [Nocardiopsis flavescens]|uniref:hypothetical protein n=1 Tax=Nocardiopsis flavescens TaxID=758803 RepID=UPI00364D1225
MNEETFRKKKQNEESLRNLRRGIGCTPERLSREAGLSEALGRRIRRRRGSAPRPLPQEELTALVASVEDPRLRGALLVALGLDPLYPQYTLTERRDEYMRDLALSTDPALKRSAVDSQRTLERRENRAITEVALLLAGRSEEEAAPRMDDMSEGTARQSGLDVTAMSYLCRFSSTGTLNAQDVTYWVRSDSLDVEPEVTVLHAYHTETRKGALDITALYGCSVGEVRETASSGLVATMRAHRRLTPDDGTYSFSYRVTVDSENRCRPIITRNVRSRSLKRLEFHLLFSKRFRPDRSWWFRTDMAIEGELEPEKNEGRHLTHFDQGKYIYRIFEGSEIYPGSHHGISWPWP